ncbi:polymer-forming cytoskeletal protein, partial [bacterium]
MFPKNKKDQHKASPAGIETILGVGTSAEGTIATKGDFFVGGSFKGKIESGGNVVINKGTKVEADITAVN